MSTLRCWPLLLVAAEVTIEVWRGATMLAQETYTPRYMEFRPNGDHCPPVLKQARDRLVIMAPTT